MNQLISPRSSGVERSLGKSVVWADALQVCAFNLQKKHILRFVTPTGAKPLDAVQSGQIGGKSASSRGKCGAGR